MGAGQLPNSVAKPYQRPLHSCVINHFRGLVEVTKKSFIEVCPEIKLLLRSTRLYYRPVNLVYIRHRVSGH